MYTVTKHEGRNCIHGHNRNKNKNVNPITTYDHNDNAMFKEISVLYLGADFQICGRMKAQHGRQNRSWINNCSVLNTN